MRLRRWTPLVFLSPDRYVSRDAFWEEFDLETWSRDAYEWLEDPWNGLRDFAKLPSETVSRGQGDCEDYALVAVSWALAHDRPRVGIALCWEWPTPWPAHAVAFDAEQVYSSGSIFSGSLDEWLEQSRYDWCLRRLVT